MSAPYRSAVSKHSTETRVHVFLILILFPCVYLSLGICQIHLLVLLYQKPLFSCRTGQYSGWLMLNSGACTYIYPIKYDLAQLANLCMKPHLTVSLQVIVASRAISWVCVWLSFHCGFKLSTRTGLCRDDFQLSVTLKICVCTCIVVPASYLYFSVCFVSLQVVRFLILFWACVKTLCKHSQCILKSTTGSIQQTFYVLQPIENMFAAQLCGKTETLWLYFTYCDYSTQHASSVHYVAVFHWEHKIQGKSVTNQNISCQQIQAFIYTGKCSWCVKIAERRTEPE